ncbi:MAG: NAD-dependent epimerase/dehydratase family protein [Deltaproteobacteria bacterium]|nr:NAD-dependent epimerase/dehydratase family protein [Deltaproteobacteria bacterium]
MLTVVTGAYGHVGANLVRALLERGDEVRAADKRQTEALAGLDVEHVPIDVLEPESLEKAFGGADTIFHLAAIISITGDPTGIVRRVNVEGPRNATQAALACGVSRFVHCSSVHAFDLERSGPELTETGPRATGDHSPPYDRSKNEGENEVHATIAEGLDAVIVNPTAVIGPHDYGPSRMGELLLQLRDRKIPVNVGGGFDFVDVRDLAAGMLAAEQSGRTGENYLLSGHRHSSKELAQLVAQVTGVKAPRISVPVSLTSGLAPLVLKLTPSNQVPLITPDSMHALQFSPSVCHYKASKELGYVARPIIETLRDTYAWFDEYTNCQAEG